MVISPIKTLIRSLRLILAHFPRYLLLYLLTALPLSLTQTSLSITLHPYRLRLLLRQPFAVERPLALSLVLSRSLISLPLLLPLSLLSSTSTISSTFSFLSSPTAASPPPSLLSTARLFPRVLATSICAQAVTWLYLCVPSLVLSLLPTSAAPAAFFVRMAALAGEAHLMAVMSTALVATVVSPEGEIGWDAVRTGWRAVGRRKWCAWSVTVAFAFGTGGIWGGVLEHKMDGQDWSGVVGLARWMVGIGRRAWLVPLYGFLVLLSYVVYTVLYWECRKLGNNSKGDGELQLQLQESAVE